MRERHAPGASGKSPNSILRGESERPVRCRRPLADDLQKHPINCMSRRIPIPSTYIFRRRTRAQSVWCTSIPCRSLPTFASQHMDACMSQSQMASMYVLAHTWLSMILERDHERTVRLTCVCVCTWHSLAQHILRQCRVGQPLLPTHSPRIRQRALADEALFMCMFTSSVEEKGPGGKLGPTRPCASTLVPCL